MFRLASTSGKPIGAAMLIVAACFTGSLAAWELSLRSMDQRATHIVGDVAPSVEHISAARTELRRLEMHLADYRGGLEEGRPSRADITRARFQLDSELTAYRALASLPEEVELRREVEDDLVVLDAYMLKTLDEADANSLGTSKVKFREVLGPRIARLHDALARLQARNASHARQSAQWILDSRRDARLVTAIPCAVGVLAAGVAFAFSKRARRVARSVEGAGAASKAHPRLNPNRDSGRAGE